jgi:hypothetical protein
VEWELAGETKYSEKTYPSATLFTTNPTWPDLGSKSDRRGGKLATNRQSYGTAIYIHLISGTPVQHRWISVIESVSMILRYYMPEFGRCKIVCGRKIYSYPWRG